MHLTNPVTTLILAALALLSIGATLGAIGLLRHTDRPFRPPAWQRLIVAVIAITTLGMFVTLWLTSGDWQPVTSHRDGLLLMSCLLASLILFIQTRPRLAGLSAFALPVLTFMLAWGVCASGMTFHLFDMTDLHKVWRGIHLTGVYLGTACCGVAAIAGGMYLYVHYRLKRKDNLMGLGRLASLEALEKLIIRTSTVGFALLTVGLVSGLIVVSEGDSPLPAGWWFTPKIILATLAWLVYALVMNIRYASGFRGRRAAWLSIFGLALLLATYIVVTSLPAADAMKIDNTATAEVTAGGSTTAGDNTEGDR